MLQITSILHFFIPLLIFSLTFFKSCACLGVFLLFLFSFVWLVHV